MKKTLLILICIAVAENLAAQIKFQHLYGGPGYDDIQEVIQTPDQGFIMCGTTESFGAGQTDILVIKTDDAGIVQWSKAYGSTGNDFGVGIKKDPAGGYVVAGYTYGLSQDTLTDDFLLFRINSSGVVAWSKTYGGAANDEAHALAVMPDSGFVIAGTTSSFGGVTSQAGYVVRTDANGTMLWAKAITQNSDQQLFAVDVTNDGGCVVTGYTYVSSFRLFDIFAARLDASGNKQWIRNYGGSNSEQGFSVKQSLTGGFVIAGYTASFGTGQDDAFILRTQENGDVTWFNTYGTTDAERARTVLWGTGDGILISGQAKVQSPVGSIDNDFLLRTDTTGNVLWSKTYGPSVNVAVSWSSALCDDGGYVLGGLTGGFGAVQNDAYLIKTNDLGGSGCNQASPQLFSTVFTPSDSSDGTFTNGGTEAAVVIIKTNAPVTTGIECNSTGVGIGEHDAALPFLLFPNPAAESAQIVWNETGVEATISLTDMQGKTVFERTGQVTPGMRTDLKNLQQGIYFLRVVTGHRNFAAKLVVTGR